MTKRIRHALRRLERHQSQVQHTLVFDEGQLNTPGYAKERYEYYQASHDSALVDEAAIKLRVTELEQILAERDFTNEKLRKLLVPYGKFAGKKCRARARALPAVIVTIAELTGTAECNPLTGDDYSDDSDDSINKEDEEDKRDGEATEAWINTEPLQVDHSAVEEFPTHASMTTAISTQVIGGNTLDSKPARVYTQLPMCTTIVLNYDGTWVELRCRACSGNASPRTRALLRGAEGVLEHWVKDHGFEPVPLWQVVDVSKVREVSLDEIKEICNGGRAGMPYVDSVIVEVETAQAIELRKGEVDGRDDSYDAVPWAWSKHHTHSVAGAPCVVKHPNGKWYLLACPKCQGNSTNEETPRWFDGAKAFYQHLHHAHSGIAKDASLALTIETCQIRELNEREVESLRQGYLDVVGVAQFPVLAGLKNPSDKHPAGAIKVSKRKHEDDGALVKGHSSGGRLSSSETQEEFLARTVADPRLEEQYPRGSFNFRDHLPGTVEKKRKVADSPHGGAGRVPGHSGARHDGSHGSLENTTPTSRGPAPFVEDDGDDDVPLP